MAGLFCGLNQKPLTLTLFQKEREQIGNIAQLHRPDKGSANP
jgi:hypothetical protein